MSDALLDFLRTHEEAFRSRARLASLYSDFRGQRTTNPDGYLANSNAWLRALSAAARAGELPAQSTSSSRSNDKYILHSGESLASALQTPELGRPLALGAVLRDAIARKELIQLREFSEGKQSIYAKRWVPTAWEVASWSLRKLGLVGEGGGGDEDKFIRGDFVVVANIESAAKAVLDRVPTIATSNTARIFSRELFAETFASALGNGPISDNDLSVLLTHLSRDRQAITYNSSAGVIKFPSAASPQPSAITEEDISIASLRTLIASLNPQITNITTQISTLDSQAREAVAQKRLPAAKTFLRQKKALESKLTLRTATLAQLEDVYAKIEQAADNVEMVQVMETAGRTLKSLNRQTGGVERVQDVVEGLREEMMNADEIGSALNEISAGAIDDVEVEDELEELERVEKEKVGTKQQAARAQREKDEVEETRQRLAELDAVGDKVEEKPATGIENRQPEKETVGAS